MPGDMIYDPDVANLTLAQCLKHFNGMLAFLMGYMAFCAFNYGYDVGTFGGVQGLHSFTSKFGVCDENGVCALPGWLSSVMTATPFLGKTLGCIACGWIAEKWGRKVALLGLCLISFTSSIDSRAQFTLGRIITYGQTGMAIVVVPIYQAETAPKELRGMFASTIQVLIILGQVVSSLITFGTKNIPNSSGWRIPIGLQLVAPAIEALMFARTNEDKGTWAEIFDSSNRIRTAVAVLAMFGQQITGQAFPSQYGVIFYQSQGFGDKAFLFNVLSNVVSLVAVIFTWFYVDEIGRRPVLMTGGFFMGLWLFILGGVGTTKPSNLTGNLKGLEVASIILFGFFYNLSWAPCSYVVVSEAAALRLKEKTNLFASVISVLTTFVTSFTTPYLINAQYANLGGKVGFIYGSFNIAMVVLTFFFIPELKGRTLEEVDQLFASGAPLRKFKKIQTRTATEMYEEEIDRKTGKQGNVDVTAKVA
ncbi:general substrate transporter [Xylariaceae sp. FL1651]|nr:general substrate transporter [Xylariaceae sp. FL1651]